MNTNKFGRIDELRKNDILATDGEVSLNEISGKVIIPPSCYPLVSPEQINDYIHSFLLGIPVQKVVMDDRQDDGDIVFPVVRQGYAGIIAYQLFTSNQFTLLNSGVLPELAGVTWNDLPAVYQQTIKRFKVQYAVISDDVSWNLIRRNWLQTLPKDYPYAK